jgi:CheY-like chemotaxis protein
MPTALIADDEPHLASYLRDALAAAWPELDTVHVAGNGVDAAERIAALAPDVAFLDIRMPGFTASRSPKGSRAARGSSSSPLTTSSRYRPSSSTPPTTC